MFLPIDEYALYAWYACDLKPFASLKLGQRSFIAKSILCVPLNSFNLIRWQYNISFL